MAVPARAPLTGADALPGPAADVRARPGRLAVGVVGCGRVGAALGAALEHAGHRVVGASGESTASRRRRDALLPHVPSTSVEQTVADADLVLLTVPDDALAPVVRRLTTSGALAPGRIVVHTCGARGLDVLDPLAEAGALPLALHPVMTFTGTTVDLERLRGCVVGVTAPDGLVEVGQALVVEMGAEPEVVEPGSRAAYHAALAHAANHLVTLVADAADVLRATGVQDPGRLLGPLLSAALDGALRSGDAALTGPVSRGDAGTVARHLDALEAADPDAAAAYRALALRTTQRAAAARRLPADAAQVLTELLAGDDLTGDDPGVSS